MTVNTQETNLLKKPRQLPDIVFPESNATVDIRLINTTSHIRTETSKLFDPPILGHDTLDCPSHAFLISNRRLNQHVLFDLGMRTDWRNALPLELATMISKPENETHFQVSVEVDVADILDDDPECLGIGSESISAVIWSHHHFDNRGDITMFPSHTMLVFGAGLRQTYGPTFRAHGENQINEEFHGRRLLELDESFFNIDIGGFMAHDAFGDGSFYLMSSPGHAAGHLCGLARVTAKSRQTFVFLGGDVAHHVGEFRPSPYNPLPKEITLKSTSWYYAKNMSLQKPLLKERKRTVYRGADIRDRLHPTESATEPFYTTLPEPVVFNAHVASESLIKMEVFDAHEDVLVCLAHDLTLMDFLPLYPYTFNDWKVRRYKEKLRWQFLRDFDLDDEYS